jgi:hypothetical protein
LGRLQRAQQYNHSKLVPSTNYEETPQPSYRQLDHFHEAYKQ